MSKLYDRLFGKPDDLKAIYEQGAIIIDVRSPEEFVTGHIAGAINIPVNLLEMRIEEIRKKDKPVITCCRSGMLSGAARSALMAAGIQAYNGGPWDTLNQKIQKP